MTRDQPSTERSRDSQRVRVSVIIMTYQHEAYIARALESVLVQDGAPSYEVLVGDDVSTDGTRAIVNRYAQDYPDRIRAFLPPVKLGHQGKVLFGEMVKASRGDYIARMDGDDYWTAADKLRRQV